MRKPPIPIFAAAPAGQQFVVYADSCSGIAGAPHEATFAAVNEVLRSLARAPQFICFPGDEIMGLTTDAAALRAQWSHFFEQELAWLDRETIPIYHTTGNHTVYDQMSEDIFGEVMAHLPRNGPADQRGLAFYVERQDLLLIFVNTLWSGTGGEGTLELDWLERALSRHRLRGRKLVFGHHPVWAVNGYAGAYQRQIEAELGRRFWSLLEQYDVVAYFCSHILAFDVQAHRGVLQICTAGAGTAHRMPAENEYLHLLQAAVDDSGLRYQVLDRRGRVREWLAWNWRLPPAATWAVFAESSAAALPDDCLQELERPALIVWQIEGEISADDQRPQTLFCARAPSGALPYLWLGVSGANTEVTALLSPRAHRSPHRWRGPALAAHRPFSLQFALHSGMGPGGLLWRWSDAEPWSSMLGASSWGAERLPWSHDWVIGAGEGRSIRGLALRWHHQFFALGDYLS